MKRREVEPLRERRWTLGVDLGQMADATAIAAIETVLELPCWRDEDGVVHVGGKPRSMEHRVRKVERLPLRMSFPLQAEHIRGRVRAPALRGGREPDLVVDSTGLGRPVLELLEVAGLRPIGVTITAGADVEQAGVRSWRVPKELLINRVSASMHSGELVFAEDLEDGVGLRHELQDFQVSYTAGGHLTFAARVGAHDDRVLALAIGLWWAHRHGLGPGLVQQRLLGV
jgi:hypothetical protein